MYPEELSYQYTGMGTQILAPQERNIPFSRIIFPIAGYVSFRLFSSKQTYFDNCKPFQSMTNVWPLGILANSISILLQSYQVRYGLIEKTCIFNGMPKKPLDMSLETPKNLEIQSATWSDYKHHNTLKFLVLQHQILLSHLGSVHILRNQFLAYFRLSTPPRNQA